MLSPSSLSDASIDAAAALAAASAAAMTFLLPLGEDPVDDAAAVSPPAPEAAGTATLGAPPTPAAGEADGAAIAVVTVTVFAFFSKGDKEVKDGD